MALHIEGTEVLQSLPKETDEKETGHAIKK